MANDYGYFGSGSTGYAHYKQSFDRNFGGSGGGGGNHNGGVDALPPLTEWDSRSLQQKMVGGFSSQSR